MTSHSKSGHLMFKSILGAAAALFLSVACAHATPVQTLSFSGVLGYGYESSGVFAAPNSQLAGKAYTVSLTFDPGALTGDTCGTAANNSCNWNFGAGGLTETVTINGVTKTYTATSGQIQYGINGGDTINITANGPNGLYIGGQFTNSSKTLFKSQTNANDPLLLVDIANLAVSGQFQSSGLGPDHNTGFGANLTLLNAAYASGLVQSPSPTPVKAPEAASIFFLLAGAMLMMGLLGRRRVAVMG